jgi:hypothetical protein
MQRFVRVDQRRQFIWDSDEKPSGKPHPYLLTKIKDGKISLAKISPIMWR